jgi:hypothetical protein
LLACGIAFFFFSITVLVLRKCWLLIAFYCSSLSEKQLTELTKNKLDRRCKSKQAWFRELPGGVLPADEVTRCQSEEDCARLCARLPPPKAAILDWAVNLMADVAEQEKANKMSTRNVAMVFAPNMTQALDPLTALKDSVQVMKFLNMLTERAIKQRGRSS